MDAGWRRPRSPGGPDYLYPDHVTTPGLVNPAVTQANIRQTICAGLDRDHPAAGGLHNHLKQQQLATSHASDRNLGHFEEDHFISLELGATHTTRGISGLSVGTPTTRSRAAGPSGSLSRAKTKDAVRTNSTRRSAPAG